VEKLLEAKPGKPSAGLALMLSKAAKHSISGYVDPSSLAKMLDKLPPPLTPVKPLFLANNGVAWADVGYTSKLGATLTFKDEKEAARGRKVIDAVRALGSLALAGLGDSVAAKSKPLAALMSKVEKSLDDGTVEQKGTAVEAAFALTIDKATAAGMIKDFMNQVVVAVARTQSTNNLKQIGLAFHNYHDQHGALPPAAVYDKDGKALLSWRVLILPYIEQDALYKEFRLNEPWDSEHNKKLIAKIPPIYVTRLAKPSAVGGTFYQGFLGKMAAFEGKRGLRFVEFTDGLSNTIMVAESAVDVPWTKPADLPFDPDGKLPKLGGLFEGGFNTLFCDGSVRFLKATIKPDTLKMMITRNGGEVIPGDD
jgi:prepilin-type processing-associated H-X9-DG protein